MNSEPKHMQETYLGESYSLGILISYDIELMLLFPISIANMR